MCYGFFGCPQERSDASANRVNCPPSDAPRPNSPFSPVDRFLLLTGPFGPGCPSSGKCNSQRWYVVTRSLLSQPASRITADRLATPETNRSSLATHTAQVNNRDRGRMVIVPKMVKRRLSGVIFQGSRQLGSCAIRAFGARLPSDELRVCRAQTRWPREYRFQLAQSDLH
jgi:hypothetical protein